LEVEGVKRHAPAVGGVFHQGDFLPRAVEQTGHGVVGVLHLFDGDFGGFVAADFRFQFQVRAHSLDHGCGHGRGTAIVQVDAVGDAWGLGSGALNVDGHGGCP